MAKQQFVKIDYELLYNDYYRKATTVFERDLLVQIKGSRNKKTRDRGVINRDDGYIEFGFSDAFGMSSSTYKKTILGLRAKGFIKLVAPGKFPRQKAVYALSNKWKLYQKNLINTEEEEIDDASPGT